jgi:hypothetical protein
LVLVLLGALFARDVIRSAHDASSPRREENRNFAALATVLIEQENQFDQHLDYLLSTGQGLSRAHFEARLEQLDQQLPDWLTQASFLDSPALAHHVNNSLATLTDQRAGDYQVILRAAASVLQLPWTATSSATPASNWRSAQASLVTSTTAWGTQRRSLVREPGRVTMPATTDLVGTMDLSSTLAALVASPSLEVTRGIGITAVLVRPSPLPAPAGELLLPPTRSIRLGVTVTNASYVRQRVALAYTFIETNGARTRQSQTMTTTLGPLESYAFEPKLLTAVSGERAVLSIDVSGAPAGAHMSTTRHYVVIVSPSGNS